MNKEEKIHVMIIAICLTLIFMGFLAFMRWIPIPSDITTQLGVVTGYTYYVGGYWLMAILIAIYYDIIRSLKENAVPYEDQ